jgi:hypothetical protein
MARDYSPTTFFLRVPKPLLSLYFHQYREVLQEITFEDLEETRASAEMIFEAFSALPEPKQAEIEAEFQDIDSMAFPGGVKALIEEATDHPHFNTSFPEAISQFDSDHGKVMWTFLEHREYWAGATSILYAENIADAYWKKRNDLPHIAPLVEPEDAERLEKALIRYFRTKEGRGRHCKVDIFRRHEKEYFFAYLSDFGKSELEFEGTVFNPRARTPAFEIIFVYTQTEGSLDIYAPRNTKYVADLQLHFADRILELDELDEFAGDDLIYNLNALADRDFVFKRLEDFDIESVNIRLLRLFLLGAGKWRVTLEADPKHNPKAVYDLLDKLNPPSFNVTQAEIVVTFRTPLPGTRTRDRKFKISYPNWCNLRHHGRDETIRKMLISSGIEETKTEATKEDSAA